jgi:hypothetical protein
MDRTVPSQLSEEIELYVRTYFSLLRSTREVQLKTLIEAHTSMNSALHVDAEETYPDFAAFIYVILRLPDCIAKTRLVVMGQSKEVFSEHGYPDVETWQLVSAPGRRRYTFYDGKETVAVYIASRSDIDDLIPSLTAYEIERGKLHRILNRPEIIKLLGECIGNPVNHNILKELSRLSDIPLDDLDRLRRIWEIDLARNLLLIAQEKQSLSVLLLTGSLVDYKRATRRWWNNIQEEINDIHFEDHPIYFVSSNTHSLANLLGGFALRRENELVEFIYDQGTVDLQKEYADIQASNVPSSWENFLYYTLKKFEDLNPGAAEKRIKHEILYGIQRVPSQHVFDVEFQVAQINKLDSTCLDPRLQFPGIELLKKSNSLIVNIDFPLGLAAYLVLTEIVRNSADIRGFFIMGKAATLNGRIGDVMIPNVVHDEHSKNTFLFNNCFSADDVAPYLVYGTVMDNQKSITALGTFLQNEDYMSVFYHEGYTIIEMEAGPYLSSIYEMIRPERYPTNELINLYGAPFPIGILHYASDTPMSKGKNLGFRNLSYFGMDPTYGAMTAILHEILETEIDRLR